MADGNFGVQLWLYDPATQVLVRIAEVTSVTPASPERSAYQTSHHATVDAHTYAGEALAEPGTLTARINYSSGSASDTQLLSLLGITTPEPYKVIMPGGLRKMEGNAILLKYEVQDMPLTGKQEAVLTLQASGARTQGAAA